jgi:hypothetical protein
VLEIGYYRRMIDALYSLSGFGVGLLVSMTGVGGGSLMTPRAPRRAPRWRRGRPHHPKDGRSRRARALTLILKDDKDLTRVP